jgi:hypothetical protein
MTLTMMKSLNLSFRLFLLFCCIGGNPCKASHHNDDDSRAVVVLEDFASPQHEWTEMNDPVMGGKSTGTFTINENSGRFVGEVVDVPFLHAPGFIQVRTTDRAVFPDISSCQQIQIVAQSHAPYSGYRISFGNAHAPGGKFFAYGYKANLEIEQSDTPINVTIPITQFTDFWDDATGDPIHTCEENPLYCPDELTLQNIQRLAVWGEGVAGHVDLQIYKIQATGCNM